MKRPGPRQQTLRTVAPPGAEGKAPRLSATEQELSGAKAELGRKTRELDEFFDNAPIGMHWVGPDGTILRANRAELELLGYSGEEYLGKNIEEFFLDPGTVGEMMARLHAGEELRDFETRIRCRDGSMKHVSINSNALWEDGKLLKVRAFTRDITDRKQVEEARSRVAAIVESSHDAIISKTLDGRIVSWNREAERLFGYTAAEAIGQHITMLLPPDRLAEEGRILARLQRGERIEEFETIRLSKGGERLEVSLSVSPVRDGSGKVIGASKTARDISARRRAELADQRARETSRFLADAGAALADLIDYESALRQVATLAVPAFADWCVIDVQEPDGTLRRLSTEHVEPEKLILLDEIFRRYPPNGPESRIVKALATGKTDFNPAVSDELLVRIARSDEHLDLIRRLGLKSYICTPIRSASVRAVITFATTVSGRQYGPTDLAAAEDLAHRAAIAIENASLLRALQDADRRKNEFLAILAHELRNPLAPIRNAAQILRVKAPPIPELQWAREVIERQVLQMTRLVDDLLDVSRITKGKIELRKERLSLATLVSSAVEASRPLIKKWGHQLTISIPADPIYLDVDPTRMAQVLLNLLNNAAKYTEQGGRIALTGELEGDDVVIRVSDNGVGIPAEMLPCIFDMFTQVDRSLERAQGGLGIGLTLVQLLTEMHGGTAMARSAGTGLGSEFVLRLPAAPQRVAGRENVAVPHEGPLAIDPALRVLVVDDNQDSAESLGILLRHAGCEVRTAHDGLEAVGAASVFRPDAAILDIGLPGLNGYDAARQIRKELGAGVTLIAVTGWGQDEDRRRSKEAGFDHHLTKPVELNALHELLALVHRPRPAGEASPSP